MDYETAALIMMSGGREPILQELTATHNGVFIPPENVDGFNPVNVNVAGGSIINRIDITENGTYKASDYNCDGFDPINVNVSAKEPAIIEPLNVTSNGTYYAESYGYDGFNPVNVNVPDRYEEGYEDGKKEGEKHGRYTFPEGTSYDDIKEIVGGDNVIDETLGVGIAYSTEYYTSGVSERFRLEIYLSFSDGSTMYLYSMDTLAETSITVVSTSIDGTTGNYRVGYVRANNPDRVYYYENSSPYLIGFGAEGHRYSVSN